MIQSVCRDVVSGPVSKKTTLLFEHKHGQTVPESSTEGIKSKLEEICSATADDIRPEVKHHPVL